MLPTRPEGHCGSPPHPLVTGSEGTPSRENASRANAALSAGNSTPSAESSRVSTAIASSGRMLSIIVTAIFEEGSNRDHHARLGLGPDPGLRGRSVLPPRAAGVLHRRGALKDPALVQRGQRVV